jgi:hypothetical protein
MEKNVDTEFFFIRLSPASGMKPTLRVVKEEEAPFGLCITTTSDRMDRPFLAATAKNNKKHKPALRAFFCPEPGRKKATRKGSPRGGELHGSDRPEGQGDPTA